MEKVTIEQHTFSIAENQEQPMSVLSFLNKQIQILTNGHRLGTAMNYRRATNTLASFLADRDLHFPEITSQFIEQYSDYLLQKGMVRNSLSFHMRILRAVYNKAVRYGYTEQNFPFQNVYTGIDHTRKRAVGEDIIARLIHLKIKNKPYMNLSRDIFLFSFYTRGMAFIDIVYLRKSDVQDGIIRYTRHKTGQQLAVRIEPCIQKIIDRYAKATSKSPYIFPILKSEDGTICYHQYSIALRRHNYRLQKLSHLLGLTRPLSSYTSRHSWASMARKHNIPISVISAGMGHSSEHTTQIYLTSLENSVVDTANKGILEVFQKQETV